MQGTRSGTGFKGSVLKDMKEWFAHACISFDYSAPEANQLPCFVDLFPCILFSSQWNPNTEAKQSKATVNNPTRGTCVCMYVTSSCNWFMETQARVFKARVKQRWFVIALFRRAFPGGLWSRFWPYYQIGGLLICRGKSLIRDRSELNKKRKLQNLHQESLPLENSPHKPGWSTRKIFLIKRIKNETYTQKTGNAQAS